MRFSLRNQKKIKKAYGEEMLQRILSSLKTYFETNEEIESFVANAEKYQTVIIDDVGHTSNMIAFYIISTHYDVYNLAFKEFIG